MADTAKPRIYIAGPYTRPDPVTNVREAVRAADELLALGCAPFVPHLTHLWHLVSPKHYEEWLAIDLEWVLACHAVYRMPGESTGADKETVFAHANEIPVLYSMGEVDRFVAVWYSLKRTSGGQGERTT